MAVVQTSGSRVKIQKAFQNHYSRVVRFIPINVPVSFWQDQPYVQGLLSKPLRTQNSPSALHRGLVVKVAQSLRLVAWQKRFTLVFSFFVKNFVFFQIYEEIFMNIPPGSIIFPSFLHCSISPCKSFHVWKAHPHAEDLQDGAMFPVHLAMSKLAPSSA